MNNALTEADHLVAEFGEQRLHLDLSALAGVHERVALEGVVVGLARARHHDGGQAVRVTGAQDVLEGTEADTRDGHIGQQRVRRCHRARPAGQVRVGGSDGMREIRSVRRTTRGMLLTRQGMT